MRPALVLVLATACSAKLHVGGGVDSGAGSGDARVDAPINATPDAVPAARACAGGDAHMVGPDGTCFVMVNTHVTYVAAQTACAAMSAHLAYLKTAALDTAAEAFVGATDTFIGGTDLANEGTWLWDDGTPFQFTNWHTGEPNNAGNVYQEDCAIIAGARAGAQWDDRACDSSQNAMSGQFAYLCQY